MYLVRTPWWLRAIYPSFTWKIKDAGKVLYLTFDDGPHETATPFALDQLKQFNAKATFFCIGKNVASHPDLFQRIIAEGHAVGNHTQEHLNGWKTANDLYADNIAKAGTYIHSNLFRPPYGRIKKAQAALLRKDQRLQQPFQVIMWDVLSGDFDTAITPQQCLDNVLSNTNNGSIIVFHDSTKAWDRMNYTLPKVLKHYTSLGYSFAALGA